MTDSRLQQTIEDAWESRDSLSVTGDGPVREAVAAVLDGLDGGRLRGAEKTAKLHEVLCNNMYDFSRSVIERLQLVHSQEIERLQLADLLIGVVSYLNRDLHGNQAKEALEGVVAALDKDGGSAAAKHPAQELLRLVHDRLAFGFKRAFAVE